MASLRNPPSLRGHFNPDPLNQRDSGFLFWAAILGVKPGLFYDGAMVRKRIEEPLRRWISANLGWREKVHIVGIRLRYGKRRAARSAVQKVVSKTWKHWTSGRPPKH